jgi:hypothetical protein
MVKNFHRSTRGEIVGIWIEVEVVEIWIKVILPVTSVTPPANNPNTLAQTPSARKPPN